METVGYLHNYIEINQECCLRFQSVSPFASHHQNGVIVHLRADEWVHLCHVAAEPTENGK